MGHPNPPSWTSGRPPRYLEQGTPPPPNAPPPPRFQSLASTLRDTSPKPPKPQLAKNAYPSPTPDAVPFRALPSKPPPPPSPQPQPLTPNPSPHHTTPGRTPGSRSRLRKNRHARGVFPSPTSPPEKSHPGSRSSSTPPDGDFESRSSVGVCCGSLARPVGAAGAGRAWREGRKEGRKEGLEGGSSSCALASICINPPLPPRARQGMSPFFFHTTKGPPPPFPPFPSSPPFSPRRNPRKRRCWYATPQPWKKPPPSPTQTKTRKTPPHNPHKLKRGNPPAHKLKTKTRRRKGGAEEVGFWVIGLGKTVQG